MRLLRRQVSSQFYERTALSKHKAAMLRGGQKARAEDAVTPEEEIRNPIVLEFLDLRDEYSEAELEEVVARVLRCRDRKPAVEADYATDEWPIAHLGRSEGTRNQAREVGMVRA